jgi:hypothetical protein
MLGFGANPLNHYMTNAFIYQLDGLISSHAPINMLASKTIKHNNIAIHIVIIIK